MTLTTRDSNLYVDLLVEAVAGAFAGQKALFGTGVVTLNPTMPTRGNNGRPFKGGETIQMPYFDSIGEMADVPENGALTPVALSSTAENASVIRSGIAGEISDWATLVADGEPHREFARQFTESAMRRIDAGCITAAATTTLSNTSKSGQSITEDHVILASEEWGDEAGDMVALICHSRVRKNMRLLKDGMGRRLYEEANLTSGKPLPMFCGIPVICSDRLTPSGSVYTSYVCQRGAIGAWFNPNPMPEEDRDILAGTDVMASWLYHVEHLYQRMPGKTKPGIVKFTSTES